MLPTTQGLLAEALDCIRKGTQGQPFASRAELARASKVSDANLSRWISGTATPTLKKLESVLAALGVSLVLPEGLKSVPRSPAALAAVSGTGCKGYFPVPVLTSAKETSAAQNEEKTRNSLLVPVEYATSSMEAMYIDKSERSMCPQIQPGDTVLIERNIPQGDYDNSIYLVQKPPSVGGGYLLQRVKTTIVRNKPTVIFFSDNTTEGYAPMCFDISLYPEASLRYAVLGKVVYRMGSL